MTDYAFLMTASAQVGPGGFSRIGHRKNQPDPSRGTGKGTPDDFCSERRI